MYELFDELTKISNAIREDLRKRIVENPDVVEQTENSWVYEIMSNIPDANKIEYLKERLIGIDDLIKYKK